MPTVLEICAGAGGQALGLERAGFEHAALVEQDADACATLRLNRPAWNVLERDVRALDGRAFRGVDLLAGGVPCPGFSRAGRHLGPRDERDLFPQALRLAAEAAPRAVMLENVQGLAAPRFSAYLESILGGLRELGYEPRWTVLDASGFGVPQLRRRLVLVAARAGARFGWPEPWSGPVGVGRAIGGMMASGGWTGARAWAERAVSCAPTIVAGSKKHEGTGLGPKGTRERWAALGVDPRGLADSPPGRDFPRDGKPRLTVPMLAAIQGFPDGWRFHGRKTSAYRQVGNAFPPPVAEAVGRSIIGALGPERERAGQRPARIPGGAERRGSGEAPPPGS